MTDDQRNIEDYAARVERHLTGTAQERAWTKAELVAHLSDAAEAGELATAMERLGDPEAAASTFAELRSAPLVPIGGRFTAAAIDNLPLIAVAIALFVHGLLRVIDQGGGLAVALPPFAYIEIGNACVSLLPVQCGGAHDGAGLLYTVGLPLALAWSIIGLGLLEAVTGTTPGKRCRGLRVVTETGLRIHPVTAIARRLVLLAGPFAWADWIPFLWGDRHRISDRLTGVKVVIADPARTKPRPVPGGRSPSP